MKRIVRVSPISNISEVDKNELRRIFGPSDLIDIPVEAKTPDALTDEICSLQPDAIFLDAAGPPFSRAIRALATTFPVIEPTTELRALGRSEGPAASRVRALGRRNIDTNAIESLGDGEYA